MHGFSFFKFSCFIFVFAFLGAGGAFSKEKSIFLLEPSREGDFADVSVEPSSIDLKNYISRTFDAIRLNNDKIREFNRNTEKTISDLNRETKASIDGNNEKIREFLNRGKSEGKSGLSSHQEGESKKSESKKSESHGAGSKEAKVTKSQQNYDETKSLNEGVIFAENEALHKREKFINYCLDNLRGYPYRTGGSSPKSGFDCSGVVQYAARESLGINLPRTAQEMYNQSEKVSADAVLPGDLIFFKAGGKISHVGVYLGTDESDDSFKGKIIFFNSASDPKYRSGTIISSLSEPYWNRHFFGYGKFID